jgi:hypothetical protein
MARVFHCQLPASPRTVLAWAQLYVTDLTQRSQNHIASSLSDLELGGAFR